jgi:putative sigma-54 modulation protein
MNLKITGLHLEITPPMRDYIQNKLERVTRHIDNVIEVGVTLSVDKLVQKAEVNLLLPPGRDIHVEATEADMYAAVDVVMDKLDRQVVKHKEKLADRRNGAMPQSAPETAADEQAEA